MARAAAEDQPPQEPDRAPGCPHPREARSVIGQNKSVSAFLEAWNGGRMHHAWMLRGPQGVGKATLAYLIARALIATPPAGGGLFGEGGPPPIDTLDVPEDCPVHARIVAGSEPRLTVLRRTPHPNTGRMRGEIVVDDVRDVRRFLSLSAADGGWRVVIVDPADEMNRNAANALLKFLEEPPPETLFLLVTHAPAGLLPTIRSRCRTLDLGPLDGSSLQRVLHGIGMEPAPGTEETLAELGSGSVGAVVRLVEADGPAIYARLLAMLSADSVDREGMGELAQLCAGRDAGPRFQMVLDLTRILLARLAKSAALGHLPRHAAPTEGDVMARIAATPLQAPLWAETLAAINATTRHAVAVNLDPGQTIIDTFLKIDAALVRARTLAP